MLIVEDKQRLYARPMAKRRELTAEELEWAAKLKRIWLSKKDALGLTQTSAADKMDMTQGAVGQYLNGKIPLNDSVSMGFAKILEVKVSDFRPDLAQKFQGVWEERGSASYDAEGGDVSPGPDMLGQIPIISYVQAGEFCEAVDLFAPGYAEEYLPFRPANAGPYSYALRVEGKSNHPVIQDGEVVIVDPEKPHDSGKFVVAKRHSDGHVTLKQLKYNEGEPYLEAANENWPDRIIKVDGDWSICGVVTGKYQPM